MAWKGQSVEARLRLARRRPRPGVGAARLLVVGGRVALGAASASQDCEGDPARGDSRLGSWPKADRLVGDPALGGRRRCAEGDPALGG
jgi:hypothetical protein